MGMAKNALISKLRSLKKLKVGKHWVHHCQPGFMATQEEEDWSVSPTWGAKLVAMLLTFAVLEHGFHGALPVGGPANAGRSSDLVLYGPPALPEVYLVVIVNKEKCCEGKRTDQSGAPPWMLPGHPCPNLRDAFPPCCSCQGVRIPLAGIRGGCP